MGVLFHGGADRFEGDVVQPAELVAAGGIALCRLAVPRQAFLELFYEVEEGARGRQIAHILQHVGFGTDQLVGFGQVGAAAAANDLLGDGGRKRVAGYAGEGIRAAALEGDVEVGQ